MAGETRGGRAGQKAVGASGGAQRGGFTEGSDFMEEANKAQRDLLGVAPDPSRAGPCSKEAVASAMHRNASSVIGVRRGSFRVKFRDPLPRVRLLGRCGAPPAVQRRETVGSGSEVLKLGA